MTLPSAGAACGFTIRTPRNGSQLYREEGVHDDIRELPRGVQDYEVRSTLLARPPAIKFLHLSDEDDKAVQAGLLRRFADALDAHAFSHEMTFVDECRDVSPARREWVEHRVYADLLAWLDAFIDRSRVPPLHFARRRISLAALQVPPEDMADYLAALPAPVSRGAMEDFERQNRALPVFPTSSVTGTAAVVRWPEPPPPPPTARAARRSQGQSNAEASSYGFPGTITIIRGGSRGETSEPLARPVVGPPAPWDVDVRLSRIGLSADLSQAVVAVDSFDLRYACGRQVLVLRRTAGGFRVIAAEWGGCLVH